MTRGHGNRRNCQEHSPWFHPCAASAMWVMAVACVRHPVPQLLHPMPHRQVVMIEVCAAPRASVTAAPGASGVMHPVQHIYISERF